MSFHGSALQNLLCELVILIVGMIQFWRFVNWSRCLMRNNKAFFLLLFPFVFLSPLYFSNDVVMRSFFNVVGLKMISLKEIKKKKT